MFIHTARLATRALFLYELEYADLRELAGHDPKP